MSALVFLAFLVAGALTASVLAYAIKVDPRTVTMPDFLYSAIMILSGAIGLTCVFIAFAGAALIAVGF